MAMGGRAPPRACALASGDAVPFRPCAPRTADCGWSSPLRSAGTAGSARSQVELQQPLAVMAP